MPGAVCQRVRSQGSYPLPRVDLDEQCWVDVAVRFDHADSRDWKVSDCLTSSLAGAF